MFVNIIIIIIIIIITIIVDIIIIIIIITITVIRQPGPLLYREFEVPTYTTSIHYSLTRRAFDPWMGLAIIHNITINYVYIYIYILIIIYIYMYNVYNVYIYIYICTYYVYWEQRSPSPGDQMSIGGPYFRCPWVNFTNRIFKPIQLKDYFTIRIY